MFEIKLTVEMPDLLKAAELLVNCAIKVSEVKKAGLETELERVQAIATTETPVAPYTAPAVPLPDPTPVTPTVTRPVAQPAVSATTAAPVPPVAAPTGSSRAQCPCVACHLLHAVVNET